MTHGRSKTTRLAACALFLGVLAIVAVTPRGTSAAESPAARLGSPFAKDINDRVDLGPGESEAPEYRPLLSAALGPGPKSVLACKALLALAARFPDALVSAPTGDAARDNAAQRSIPLSAVARLALARLSAADRSGLLSAQNAVSMDALRDFPVSSAPSERARMAMAERFRGTSAQAVLLGQCMQLAYEDGRPRDVLSYASRLKTLAGPADRFDPLSEVLAATCEIALAHPSRRDAVTKAALARLDAPAGHYALHLAREARSGLFVEVDGKRVPAREAAQAETKRLLEAVKRVGWGPFSADAGPGFSGELFGPVVRRVYVHAHNLARGAPPRRSGDFLRDLLRNFTGRPRQSPGRRVYTVPVAGQGGLYVHRGDEWQRFALPDAKPGSKGKAESTPGRIGFTRLDSPDALQDPRNILDMFRRRAGPRPRQVSQPPLYLKVAVGQKYFAAVLPAKDGSKGEADINTLAVFSLEDGRRVWQIPAPGNAAGEAARGDRGFSSARFSGAPLLDYGVLYVGGAREVGGSASSFCAAFDAGTGRVLWSRTIARARPFDESLGIAGSGMPEPTTPVLRAGLVVLGTGAGTLAAYHASDGAPAWIVEYATERKLTERRSGRGKVRGHDVAVRGWRRGVVKVEGAVALHAPTDSTRLYAHDLGSGRVLWVTPEGGPTGGLLLGARRGRVYEARANGSLVEYALENGEAVFRADDLAGGLVGDPRLTERGVFALFERELVRYDVDERRLADRWPLPEGMKFSKDRGALLTTVRAGDKRLLVVSDKELVTVTEMKAP